MSIKLILAFVLVGLVCYVLGRPPGRRGGSGGEPMLQTSAPLTLDAAHDAAYGGTLDAAFFGEDRASAPRAAFDRGDQDLLRTDELQPARGEGSG